MAKKTSKAMLGSPAPYESQIRSGYYDSFGKDAYYGTMFPYLLNQESANKQMAFEEYMSSSSHQREVQDLVAAGLNPVLSANGGAPGSAGAMATADNTATAGAIQKRLLNRQISSNEKLAKKERAQQLRIAREQILAQQYMNKYSTDMSYSLGALQSANQLIGTKYAANASAAAQRFAASQAAAASMYNADQARAAQEFTARTQYATGSQQRQHEKDMQAEKYYYEKNMKIWDWTHQNGIQGLLTNPFNAMLGLSYYNTPNLYGRY